MGRVEGKVAFITGAARGQGRSHAVRLAQEGADIIAIDICDKIDTSVAEPSTPEDLAETVRLVEAADRRIVAAQADVRDYGALKAALDGGVEQLGRLDIVCANAGMWSYGLVQDITEAAWQETIDINLTGAWHTVKAAIPHLRAGGRGGSIIITSSAAGLKAYPNCGPYVSAKHGVVGLMRTLALELAGDSIRANSVHPTNVDTALIRNQLTYDLFRPDLENPTYEDVVEGFKLMNALPVACIDPSEISNAVLFLASDEAKYITGATLTVDAGLTTKQVAGTHRIDALGRAGGTEIAFDVRPENGPTVRHVLDRLAAFLDEPWGVILRTLLVAIRRTPVQRPADRVNTKVDERGEAV